MVVEGVGGLTVPLGDNLYIFDLVNKLRLPLIIVAKNTLGVINHTLLTLRVAHQEGLYVKGVIMNCTHPQTGSIAEETNPDILQKLIDVPMLGVFPYLRNLSKYDLDMAFAQSIGVNSLMK
jgi:dethiobiotin synthetase